MGELATGHVRAFIARTRVAELQSRGWRIVGPGEEGSLLMEGPQTGGQTGGAPQRLGLLVDDLFDDLVAAAVARADRADAAYAVRRRAA